MDFEVKETNEAAESSGVKTRRIQIIAICIFALMIAAMIFTIDGKLSIDSILSIAEKHHAMSVLFLLLLFGIKSMTIVVPIDSLYMVCGMLYSPLEALLVSYMGITVGFSVPYILGRWSGGDGIEKLMKKYPKIDKILSAQQENEVLIAFLARIIGGIPYDVMSMYFGACRMSYIKFILSSLAGCSLTLVTMTLIGDAILEPTSPQFITLLAVRVLISIAAIVFAYFWNRKKKKKQGGEKSVA